MPAREYAVVATRGDPSVAPTPGYAVGLGHGNQASNPGAQGTATRVAAAPSAAGDVPPAVTQSSDSASAQPSQESNGKPMANSKPSESQATNDQTPSAKASASVSSDCQVSSEAPESGTESPALSEDSGVSLPKDSSIKEGSQESPASSAMTPSTSSPPMAISGESSNVVSPEAPSPSQARPGASSPVTAGATTPDAITHEERQSLASPPDSPKTYKCKHDISVIECHA